MFCCDSSQLNTSARRHLCICINTVIISHREWQRHEDRLHTSSGFQPKDSASIIDNVELCISATTQLLPLLLLFGERVVFMLPHNGYIGLNMCIMVLWGVCIDVKGVTPF
jgi:hypothetical protein